MSCRRSPSCFISSTVLPKYSRIWSVDEFDLTARRKGCDQAGNAVHDQARFAFAFAQRVLGALPLIDIRQQDAPLNDLAAGIAKLKAAVLEPAIDAVRPPESLHDLVWTA